MTARPTPRATPSHRRPGRRPLALALAVAATVTAGACGAGSEVGASPSASAVACEITAPTSATTVNILAYNSAATDPFTNVLTSACRSDTLTLNHPATDLTGQKQRAVQSLSGSSASYDLVEQFGTVYPLYADRGWTVPLDDYMTKYSSTFALDKLDPTLLAAHSYDGKQFGLPTYWSVNQLVYRKDVFDKLGLKPPTTFEEMRQAAKKIQDAGEIRYPLAIPMAPANDIQGLFGQTIRSLGGDYFEAGKPVPAIDTAAGREAVTELKSLLPYMSPQTLSFSSPEVTTQLQTGQAAMGMLVTGRLSPLVDAAKSPQAGNFAFATPPAVKSGGKPLSFVSVDGFAVAKNSKVDPDLLFQLAAVATSEQAGRSALPNALPARLDLIDTSAIPFAANAQEVLATGPKPLNPVPYIADVYSVIGAPIGDAVSGKQSVEAALAEAQSTAVEAIANAGYAQ
ncbi:carbohydrate ABC transporter substrate-binding protein (CUT1 family) [Terracoccus luteus]|uniref:Carbohydrate ABC transporter substrate-binding protein (CUT1 family) n=1 Tax=Terracoccus luteus TaxID=53356 RepID=A0A495Y0C5_9MICO|nr:sugar ABC transporter substrate-binding protein [Terracoccus luteus]RKT78865.1 carbohydrate ABC transporter substrate-binding protein (CUT1 family) [Terracoccus luteus]